MIQAKIIADSKNIKGDRITTFLLTFPRIILAELNTHRMFSRNSASSRAIPFEKMVESVEKNPFIPIAWQKDHKGMQGSEYYTDENSIMLCRANWLSARNNAVTVASMLHEKGVTKQLCNRLLEPFMWHTVILTATEFENFFNLRCPKYEDEIGKQYRSKIDFYLNTLDPTQGWMENSNSIEWYEINKGQSEIHMMALAEAMWDAYNESKPKELKGDQWHIPFGDNLDFNQIDYLTNWNNETGDNRKQATMKLAIKIAVARCARVSYTIFGEEKESNYEADIKLHDRLLESGHFSPFEHIAKALGANYYDFFKQIYNGSQKKVEFGWCDNFKGFIPYRFLLNKNN